MQNCLRLGVFVQYLYSNQTHPFPINSISAKRHHVDHQHHHHHHHYSLITPFSIPTILRCACVCVLALEFNYRSSLSSSFFCCSFFWKFVFFQNLKCADVDIWSEKYTWLSCIVMWYCMSPISLKVDGWYVGPSQPFALFGFVCQTSGQLNFIKD